MGNPAPEISAAVASMPMKTNLNDAAIAKTKAKISRAMRMAAVLIELALDQHEEGPLRVGRLDDHSAARHFRRTEQDLAAAGADRLDAAIEILDAEAEAPGRLPVRRREHGADHLAVLMDELIIAHRTHRHHIAELPSELLGIEAARRREIGGD